ncbi:MAG: type I phosphomannose isomerase catalytic subunit, partial [Verrucomicrobiota bacterium]
DRPEGMSVVDRGPAEGDSLTDRIEAWGADLLGERAGADGFPLLIKLIDSRKDLSIQVHPNDATAARYGGEAKTEMWYILDADDEASVYAGLKPGTGPEEFEQAIEAGTAERRVVRYPVRPGDATFMPGGRVHAIGAGCLILEVQQNSNTTYRIYDWGRVGPDGQPRELHIKQAFEVIEWDDDTPARIEGRRMGFLGDNELWEILTCDYFRLERLLLKESWPSLTDGQSFHALFVARGKVEIGWSGESIPLECGRSCLIPARLGEYEIRSPAGEADVMRITLP